MEQYKVSVLITFYNQEKYVDECLASVFSQKTSFGYKVVIGDDGSTDGTLDKIKEWQDKYPGRISVVVMPREDGKKYIGGTRASRNRLAILEKVDTKYFQYLDGDDYWTDENKLQTCYDILEKPENADCSGCGHAINMFHEDDPSKVKRLPGKNVKEGKYHIERYWKDMYFHTDTILFRSENIAKIPRDLLKDSFNDNLITYSFMQFGPMYYVDKEMVAYRQNDNGIWAGEKRTVSVIREMILYDMEYKINPSLRLASHQRHLKNFIYVYKNGDQIKNLDAYYEIAKTYDLPVTKKVLETQRMFSKSHLLDGVIVFGMWIRYKVFVKIVNKMNSFFRKR